MRLTHEQAVEEFLQHFEELREALAAEGERADRLAEWKAFLLHKINGKQLPVEAMHWPAPRLRPPALAELG